MSKRQNTLTRFIEDIVDDTKDFVDDILDRAKDLETDARDAIKNVVDDESTSPSGSSLAELEAALAYLTVQVNQLAEMQLATATAPASRRSAA